MTWTGTVKEAIEETIGEGFVDIVILKIEDNGGEIGRANSFEQALENFAEFLDARVVNYFWGSFEGKETADIIVNRDDVDINYVNGVPKFTRLYIYGKPDPEIVVPKNVKEVKEPKMFENLKTGCAVENTKYIDVQQLKALLEHKDDVVSALEQKILLSKNDITDCIKILKVLNPKQADSAVNSLKLLVMTLERICEYKNS